MILKQGATGSMEMSPEAIKKAEENLKKDDAEKPGKSSSTGLRPELAVFFCYLLNWVGSLIFLLLEQKDRFVRFHAAQSLILFAGLALIIVIASPIPIAGPFLNATLAVLFIVLWVLFAVRSYQGRWYRIPVISELADALEKASLQGDQRSNEPYEKPLAGIAPQSQNTAPERNSSTGTERQTYFPGGRSVRALGSSIAIFWSFVFLILLNFYSSYIAYYQRSNTGGANVWIMEPVITPSYYTWLPQMNIALVSSIIARFIMIIFDNPLIHDMLRAIINLLFALALGSLLALFPFSFSAIPDRGVAAAMPSAVRLLLLLILAAFVISAILRLVRMGLRLARNAH
jgi:uncharacterized membrane protein